MTQSEFLSGLKEALANDLSGSIIQDNVDYYRNYIIEEKKKGRNEQEVIDELGDPWVIARTIIDSAEGTGSAQESYSYEPDKQSYRQERSDVHVFGFNTWWKKLLLVLGIIGVFAIIIAVIGGIFSLVAPILVPLVIIMLVIRIFSGKRR